MEEALCEDLLVEDDVADVVDDVVVVVDLDQTMEVVGTNNKRENTIIQRIIGGLLTITQLSTII